MKKTGMIVLLFGLIAWGVYRWTQPAPATHAEAESSQAAATTKQPTFQEQKPRTEQTASPQTAVAEQPLASETPPGEASSVEEETAEPASDMTEPAAQPSRSEADKPGFPQPKDLADTAAVQAFLKEKTIAKPNSWNSFPMFNDKEKFSRFFKGQYKGALIGMDGSDLGKDLEIDFDQLRMNEADGSLSGMVTLAIFNRTLGRYERKSQPSGEGLTMFRQSGVDDSITVSWRGGRPSKELLQIFFPKESKGDERLFGTFYRKEGQSNRLVPSASFVIVRQAS